MIYYQKKFTTWVISFFIFSIILGAVQPLPAAANSIPESQTNTDSLYPYLEVVESSQDGIILAFSPPEPLISDDLIDGSHCQNVSIPGIYQDSVPGQPALPVQGVMLGIPLEANPSLQIISAESSILEGSYILYPSPMPEFHRDENNLIQYADTTFDSIEKVNAFLPDNPAEIITEGFLRHQKFLSMQFNPVHYNSLAREIRYYNKIIVKVDFNQDESQITRSGYSFEDPLFEETYQKLLVNYEQAVPWRGESVSTLANLEGLRASGDMYRIIVEQEGLYEITYADLVSAGIPTAELDTLDPQSFQIFHQDQEIAILVNGEGDGVFHSSDALLFFGQALDSKYTDENVYWLRYGVETGLRMAEADGTPSGSAAVPAEFMTTLHLEEDLDYWWEAPSGSEKDTWYWNVIGGTIPSTVLTFPLSNLSTTEHILNLHGLIKRYLGSVYPHIRVYVNGNPTPIFDSSVSSDIDNNISSTLMQSDLVEGSNALTIEVLSSSDYILVNRFDLEYYDTYFAESDQLFFDGDNAGTWEYQVDGFTSNIIQAFNLTDPLTPILIENAVITSTVSGYEISFEETISAEQHYLGITSDAYLSPLSITLDTASSLKSTANGADYIIISHSDFIDEMAPLVAYRAGQGYRVALVDVQDVYDEFNGGVFSPEAIQSFLAYAFSNWITPAPTYILLVGDGHWDYKNTGIYGAGGVNFIPPYLMDIDPWIHETASDNAFVSISGEDNLPDMFIGRFPVTTAAEAQTMVLKVLDYEQDPPVGDWNTKLSFVADNADGGGDYAQESDDIIAIIPSIYSSDTLYYVPIDYPAADVKIDLIEDINEGRLIIHYSGHSSYTRWASENLFEVGDLSSLTNSEALPLILASTCLDGYFISPSTPSLAESNVRLENAGAIASFSPTGYGLTSGHRILDQSLIDNLFKTEHNDLGYLTTQAKYDLFALLPSQGYLVDTYMLFGDPALQMQTESLALEAPTDLVASTVSSSQTDLTWVDNSTTETAFLIERSPNGVNNWAQIEETSPDVTSFSDTGLDPDTTYFYRVRAYRSGDDQYSYFSNEANATTSNELPPPTDLAASAVSISRIDLFWTDNASDETDYLIERSPDGSTGWVQIDAVGADVTTYSDTGLDPDTTWYYRVQAYRDGDSQYSAFSNADSATTYKILAPPTVLTAVAFSIYQIDLSWTDNAIDETAYLIDRSPDGSSGWSEIGSVGGNITSYSNTGLDPDTTYHYRVRAYRSDDGQYSEYSNTDSATTIALPVAPTNLTTAGVSISQIDLSWTDNAIDETDYKIERSPDGSSGWSEIGSGGANTTAFSNIDLDPDTTYHYRVRAFRSGDGQYSEYSNIDSATTIALPTAPTDLTASAISISQIDLSWTDNASDETDYKIERSPDGSNGWSEIGSVGADETSYPDPGLDPDTTYYYRVRAYRDGDGQYSDYSNVDNATTLALPSPPTGLTAAAVSPVQINLSWTDNSGDETAFLIERSPDGVVGWVQIVSVGSNTTAYSNMGLDADTTYYYRIRAYRSGDGQYSDYSNTANATTFRELPPPTDLTANAVSISQIDLSWTDNASDETVYLIEKSPDGSSIWIEIDSVGENAATYSDTGLDPDTTWYYRVRAYRDGDGQYSTYSNLASATTYDILPAPTNLSAEAISISQIDLSWTDNADDETDYLIERSPDGSSGWSEIDSVGADVTTYSDTGLEPGTTYYYRVRAFRSGYGQHSVYSNDVDATTNTLPTAYPQSVTTDEDTSVPITLTGSDGESTTLIFTIADSPDNGTLSGAAPDLTYSPDDDFNGSDSFTFTVNDGQDDSSAATVYITINPVNDAPTADTQSVSTDEDTPVAITLTGADVESSPLTFTIETQPTNGSLSGTAPNLTYTPVANFNGSDSFTFKVNDGLLDSDPATVDITVTPVNDAPTADPQSVTTDEDVPVAITLTGSDVEDSPLTFTVETQPSHGILSGTAPDLSYTPDADFNGSDSFTFSVSDGDLSSGSATVDITVNSVNDAPTANPQSVTTDEDVPVAITLTGSDVENSPLTFSIETQPSHGTLSGTVPDLTYTPDADFNGSDSFTFSVSDDEDDSAPATVSITVNPVNDAPVANPQSIGTTEDTPVAITLTGSDVEDDPLDFAVSSGPSHGTLSGTAPDLTYTPDAGYEGTDSFSFTVSDGSLTSDPAVVSITINEVNDPPTADDQDVTTAEDTPVTITLTGSDPDGDSISFEILTQPSHGPLSGTAPDLTYTPDPDFYGSDSFTFMVDDGLLDSDPATVDITVNPVNDAPTADPQSVSTDEDTSVAITLTGADVESSSLTFAVETQPSHGILSGTAPDLTYTPVTNFNGSDSFTFKVNDGLLNSDPATVDITVTPVNDAPTADPQSVTTDEDTPVAITLTGSDVESSPLTFTIETQPINGSLSGTAPNLTYTPVANFNGSDSFTFSISDGDLGSGPVTVDITVNSVNDAPTSDPQSFTTDEDTPVAITLTGSDVENSPLTFIIETQPSHGTLSGTSPDLTYSPDANFNGSDSFTFTVNDGQDDSAPATVSITVNPINDAPVANPQSVSTDEDTPVAITLTGSDVESTTLTFNIETQPSHGTLSGNAPDLTYTPDANFNGSDSFTFTDNDGQADSAAATVDITVNPVNDTPVADPQSVSTDEDTPVALTLTGSDVESTTLTFNVETHPSHGTLSGNAPDLTYTPDANFNGSDSFSFTAGDGQATSSPADVSITINEVNDPPTADSQDVSTDEDTPLAITLTGSDPDGDPLSFTILTQPSHGTLSGTAPDLSYIPDINFNGTDSFTFKVNDGWVDSAAATVDITVNPVNDPPVADPQSVSTDEDTPVAITLTGSDVESTMLTFTVETQPSHGTLSGTAPDLTYTPDAIFYDSDSFTFTVNDGQTNSEAATVDITINNTNDHSIFLPLIVY